MYIYSYSDMLYVYVDIFSFVKYDLNVLNVIYHHFTLMKHCIYIYI